MINLFKAGGDWKTEDGYNYTAIAVSSRELSDFLSNGWFRSIEDTKAIDAEFSVVKKEPEEGSDYEAKLRADIKELGGKAGGRSNIATLEKQLKDLKDGSDS